MTPEELAQRFHETYERLAPQFGYEPRAETSVPWDEVPEPNKSLMIAVAAEILLDDHIIEFTEDGGWAIQHPLACRPNLLDCEIHRRFAEGRFIGPGILGRFTLTEKNGHLLYGEIES